MSWKTSECLERTLLCTLNETPWATRITFPSSSQTSPTLNSGVISGRGMVLDVEEDVDGSMQSKKQCEVRGMKYVLLAMVVEGKVRRS